MISGMNLWEPTHATFAVDLLTAFLLGIVHGITPDEHTWPITFSYAVGGYSSRRGLRARLTFSLAFAVQRALASELAYLGLSSRGKGTARSQRSGWCGLDHIVSKAAAFRIPPITYAT
jgi:hypothetical protein